jgi:prepilin-type N-terminal cleavage/methylation domain-containing protein
MTRKDKGLTLLELVMVAVIIGILALMSGAVLVDASEKAKDSAVKSNVAAANSSLIYKLNQESGETIEEVVEGTISELNNPDSVANSGDEIKSPYNKNLNAFIFDSEAAAGQVSITIVDNNEVLIKGFGKDGSQREPLLSKVVIPLIEY